MCDNPRPIEELSARFGHRSRKRTHTSDQAFGDVMFQSEAPHRLAFEQPSEAASNTVASGRSKISPSVHRNSLASCPKWSRNFVARTVV